MTFKNFAILFSVFFLSGCGNITLNEEVILTEAYIPKINYRLNSISDLDDGISIFYSKNYFGKEDSTYNCFKPLKKEEYDLNVDFDGNFTSNIRPKNLDYSTYSFFKGIPYEISQGDVFSNSLFMTFYDKGYNPVKTITTNLALYLPGKFKFSNRNNVYIVSDTEYYYYGVISENQSEKIYVAYIKNEKLESFSYSESVFSINKTVDFKLLPFGDAYFMVSIDHEFGAKDELWLVKFTYLSGLVDFKSKMPSLSGGFGSFSILRSSDKLIFIPNIFNKTNEFLTVYIYNLYSGSGFTESKIKFNEKGDIQDLKDFSLYNSSYLGYTNNQNQTAIYEINKDLILEKTFSIQSLENTRLKNFGPQVRAFEVIKLIGENKNEKTILRVHKNYQEYQEKVLFEGIGYRKICGEGN